MQNAILSASALEISSLQNTRVKNLVKLTKRRERDQQQLTTVEGVREIDHALAAGVIPTAAYICLPLLNEEAAPIVVHLQQLAKTTHLSLVTVTPAVFSKIAYRGDSGGLLVVVPYLRRRLEDLPLPSTPFLVVVEGVEKPGNLGAILRTADAAGVDGVVICAGATDIHNPNVIRASLGALFTVPIAEASSAAVLQWLRAQQIQILAATPVGATLYTTPDMTGPVAIVMGSEAQGLSPVWLTAADYLLKIPMQGVVDSLNLSAATAILLYEVIRQRQGFDPHPTR
ncbi:MAG: RNA methyltransferase [Caldilineaceae bacterium]